jgi:hypothetical protein
MKRLLCGFTCFVAMQVAVLTGLNAQQLPCNTAPLPPSEACVGVDIPLICPEGDCVTPIVQSGLEFSNNLPRLKTVGNTHRVTDFFWVNCQRATLCLKTVVPNASCGGGPLCTPSPLSSCSPWVADPTPWGLMTDWQLEACGSGSGPGSGSAPDA